MRPLAAQTWQRDRFTVSTDPALLDKDRLIQALQTTYWARDLAPDEIWASIEGAVPFGLFERRCGQIGFARAVTDAARFAWISDVFVQGDWQGQGLGVWLMECLLNHPDLQSTRRWMLATDDAFTFYERFGFNRIADSKYMVR